MIIPTHIYFQILMNVQLEYMTVNKYVITL